MNALSALEKAILFLLGEFINQNPTSIQAQQAREHQQMLAINSDVTQMNAAKAVNVQTDPSFGGQDAGEAGPGVATAPHFIFPAKK